ncbi:MAG TPA: DUF4087 domain-containing protein [Pyrinomonadaceae bacterium]|nr:DUF4087 domain-containing protein [Pyrinomonadaceae bacterium]
MRKLFFCALLLALFVFSVSSCRSSRQTEVSVNASNAPETTQNSKKEPQSKAGAAEATPEKENPESEKKASTDSAPAAADSSGGGKLENRCGWFENPTPANAWLTDRDGEWIIGIQGGHQAEGDYPEFADDQWVKTNVNYGYGCACLRVKVDYKTQRVLEIASATAKPLSACRQDPALKEPLE